MEEQQRFLKLHTNFEKMVLLFKAMYPREANETINSKARSSCFLTSSNAKFLISDTKYQAIIRKLHVKKETPKLKLWFALKCAQYLPPESSSEPIVRL